ncbi:transcription regulator HTH, apses-type DNA-binding domain-containing protein [Sporodiniella umbellata]|nr:transcription regulator HTH, apses-type DNA-binding domain-containing protein [Sporodiniella umbellata]
MRPTEFPPNDYTTLPTEYWPVYPEAPKHKIATSIWDDEGTMCYQVDVRGISVARRQDNDMINGTKLLNVTGMSRGKRDGILKNERGRVVVKVGAMHLKGVWITFARAKALAFQYSILDYLYPLFLEDPSGYFYPQIDYFLPYPQENLPSLQHNLISEESLFSFPVDQDYYLLQQNTMAPAPSVPSMLPSFTDTINYYSPC